MAPPHEHVAIQSGRTWRVVSPAANGIVTRELAREVERVLERFAIDAGATAEKPIGVYFRPGIFGHHRVGRAADIYAVGGVGAHMWKGMSRSDVKELGDTIDAGEACLLVVGESTIEDAIDKASLKADKHVKRQLSVNATDVDAAVVETAKQLG